MRFTIINIHRDRVMRVAHVHVSYGEPRTECVFGVNEAIWPHIVDELASHIGGFIDTDYAHHRSESIRIGRPDHREEWKMFYEVLRQTEADYVARQGPMKCAICAGVVGVPRGKTLSEVPGFFYNLCYAHLRDCYPSLSPSAAQTFKESMKLSVGFYDRREHEHPNCRCTITPDGVHHAPDTTPLGEFVDRAAIHLIGGAVEVKRIETHGNEISTSWITVGQDHFEQIGDSDLYLFVGKEKA